MRKKIVVPIFFLLLGLLFAVSCVYLTELYLRKTDIFINELPFDSNFYRANKKFYANLISIPKGSSKLTWGHSISYEKINGVTIRNEFKIDQLTKDKDEIRILVVGDSLTWGAGVDINKRYSNILEKKLNHKSSPQKFHVINCSYSGAPLKSYVNMLKKTIDKIEPHLLIIGFCHNDPQPRSESYRVEKEIFNKKYKKN